MSSRPEQEWDEQEQAWMLALGAWRDARCPGCSRHLPDTTDAEAEEGYTAEAITCHSCHARSILAERFSGEPQADAVLFVTKRR